MRMAQLTSLPMTSGKEDMMSGEEGEPFEEKMALSVKNDLAQIIQTRGKVAIIPIVDTEERALFDEYELTAMLALYSSFFREKCAKMEGDVVE